MEYTDFYLGNQNIYIYIYEMHLEFSDEAKQHISDIGTVVGSQGPYSHSLMMVGGGGGSDFFGCEILAKRNFLVYERHQDFLGRKKNGGGFWGREKSTKRFFWLC